MSERDDLIASMIAARDKLLAMADAPATEGLPVLYYPPALVERAKIFWAGAYRIEPSVPMPTVPE